MKIIYNSTIIETRPAIGDKIRLKEWTSFYTVGQVLPCEKHDCKNIECRGNDPVKLEFKGYPFPIYRLYCPSREWVYEK